MDPNLALFYSEIEKTWPQLNTSLAKYANFLLKNGKYFARGSLPEGYTIEDLVLQAVQKTLDGLKTEKTGKGLRKWDPSRVNLYKFLCGVIRSDISDLVNRKDNQVLAIEDEDFIGETTVSETAGITAMLADLEQELKQVANPDKPLQILQAMEKLSLSSADITTQNIRDLTGMSEADYKNAKRILDRAVQRVFEGRKRESR